MKRGERKTYRWIVHEDGDQGQWHLTNDQMNFLTYLQSNDFLRPDLEFYREFDEEEAND